ncbi:hypothetical protein Sste5346_009075 [Sporothrix stenoceras]|uniref:Ankyrin repeat protein n=1 Tax=Sporothrix stenoceras TaxID=5173 RepID=A0ABR3YNZ5_9PEZI
MENKALRRALADAGKSLPQKEGMVEQTLTEVEDGVGEGERSGDAATAIARWIVDEWPMLAFANLNSEKHAAEHTVQEQAQDRARSGTPFHRAAETGNYEIIEVMLNNARAIYDHPPALQLDPPRPEGTTLLDLVLSEDPESNSGETALILALRASNTPLETLDKLLCVTSTKTPLDDFAFLEAVNQGFDRAVETYLVHGLQLDAKAFNKYITMAFENLDIPLKNWSSGRSVRSTRFCWLNVVKSLISRAATPDMFTEKVVEDIIQKNLLSVWNVKCPGVPDDKIISLLLHMAVLYERHDFVERFVEAYPRSLKAQEKVPKDSNQNEKYPLWYNNHKWDPDAKTFDLRPPLADGDRGSERAKIRIVIVTKMIHLLGIDLLPDILHQSHEPFDDLCFDMSRFNASAFVVSDFIGSLIHQDKIERRQMLKYENTLK